MLKRIFLATLALTLLGLMSASGPAAARARTSPRRWAPGQSKVAAYQRQFKPVRLQPRLTVPTGGGAQEVGGVAYGRHLDLKLKDGTTVRCFPAATRDPKIVSKKYYYLPTNPHIAHDPDGTPKFSLIRFVTDKSKAAGGAEGAILHFMVEYGLSRAQQQEVASLLRQRVKGARLMGAVPLEVGAEGNSFSVISATLTDKGFTSTLITSGKAPVMEGQRVAVAARLDAYGATLLAKSLQQPTTDISVVFDFKYVVKLPAYDVRVIIDYDTYHQLENQYMQTRDKSTNRRHYWSPKWYNPFHIGTHKVTFLSESEQREMMDFLQEKGVVTFDYVQHVPDADKEIVESGLYKLVLESFFDMQKRLGQPSEEEISGDQPDKEDKEIAEARRKEAAKVNHFRYTVFQRKTISRKSKQVLLLKKVIARYEDYSMTGNVGTWYKKYKNNPKLVAEVNLDDPFFQRREMRFVIDNEAYDIFKKMVNYATVLVRVPRKGQRPFIDEVTIDRQYLEKNGQTATVTFARMGSDVQTYDYAVQWSLRGGYLYPPRPLWRKGELMAVTLAAPVRPLVVEAEADLNELSKLGVARAVVELRYKRFGKIYTDKKGLALSPTAGEPVVNKVIYRDSDSDRLEYRLLYYHKKLGRIADASWQPVEGNYIYCAPSALLLKKVGSLL